MSNWFQISNPEDVSSPALLVYAERIEENLRRLIAVVGDVNRLRPHIKTHKTAELVRLQLANGITKFKCATIAEAEMAANAGAKDVLLAYQPVGPNIDRLLILMGDFPDVRFSCIADNVESLRDLAEAAAHARTRIEVLLDLDIGQHRTGMAPDSHALELYRIIHALPALIAGGLQPRVVVGPWQRAPAASLRRLTRP
jgi:D-serine deaminase-like pyridoxal phosphate-dependent protein